MRKFKKFPKNYFAENFSFLSVKETLDFTIAVSYVFAVDLSDAGDNVTPFNVIVQVKNMPLRPPIWIRPFASASFLEKTNQVGKHKVN